MLHPADNATLIRPTGLHPVELHRGAKNRTPPSPGRTSSNAKNSASRSSAAAASARCARARRWRIRRSNFSPSRTGGDAQKTRRQNRRAISFRRQSGGDFAARGQRGGGVDQSRSSTRCRYCRRSNSASRCWSRSRWRSISPRPTASSRPPKRPASSCASATAAASRTKYLLAKEQLVQGRLGTHHQHDGARVQFALAGVAMLSAAPADTSSMPGLLRRSGELAARRRAAGRGVRARPTACSRRRLRHNDMTYAIVTLADGAVVDLGVCYALPKHYPSLGHAGRVELLGTDGVLIIDDDHTDQMMYSQHTAPHVYLPDHNVEMVFLGSGTPGDWALGEFHGAVATETRAWLDHLSGPALHAGDAARRAQHAGNDAGDTAGGGDGADYYVAVAGVRVILNSSHTSAGGQRVRGLTMGARAPLSMRGLRPAATTQYCKRGEKNEIMLDRHQRPPEPARIARHARCRSPRPAKS